MKAPLVDFRTIDDVLSEVKQLTAAGVRNFRLGQQTCFWYGQLNTSTKPVLVVARAVYRSFCRV
ncbi:MAG: hypothetical protein ACRDTH_24425 [Pseudonocardiaceae bacterium]